jgi:hypothetical protein
MSAGSSKRRRSNDDGGGGRQVRLNEQLRSQLGRKFTNEDDLLDLLTEKGLCNAVESTFKIRVTLPQGRVVEVELDAGLASAKEVMAEVERLEGTMEEHTLMEPTDEGRANDSGEGRANDLGEGSERAHQLRPVKEDRDFHGPCELFLVQQLQQKSPQKPPGKLPF